MKVRGKEIPYDLETNKVSPNQRYEKILATPIDDKINLRILVDRTIMDVFYNNGQAVHMMNAKYVEEIIRPVVIVLGSLMVIIN